MPIRDDGAKVPFIVFCTGLPASGKTTLGRSVAASLGIPSLRSDLIKESLFDSIGYSTLAWSEFLTIVARDMALSLLPSVGPCVFDVFITPEQARRQLVPLVDTIIELHCAVPYDIAWRRFVERARSGHRHPGHLDADVTLDFFVSSLEPQHVDRPFGLGGPVREISTTDFGGSEQVRKWVRAEVDLLTNTRSGGT